MKISILMPAYNAEKFISKSIESIVNQSYLNYEFIIVDDGSLDSTKEIIKMYSRENSRIKLISKSNSGITETLNFGLRFCVGEWIARMDADDLSTFDRLEKQIVASQSSPNIGLIGSNAIFIDKFDRNLYYFSYPLKHDKLKKNLLSCNRFFPHSSAFFNNELVQSLGGYRSRAGIAEDWDLWLRIASKKEIKNINEPLVKIRLHDNQISKKSYYDQAYDTRLVIVANHLSTKTNYDPIDVLTEDEFKSFKMFIFKNLEKLGLSEYLKFTKMLKNPSIKKLFLPFIFIKYLKRPFYIYSFLKLKFFSEIIHFNIASDLQKKIK